MELFEEICRDYFEKIVFLERILIANSIAKSENIRVPLVILTAVLLSANPLPPSIKANADKRGCSAFDVISFTGRQCRRRDGMCQVQLRDNGVEKRRSPCDSAQPLTLFDPPTLPRLYPSMEITVPRRVKMPWRTRDASER